MGSEECADSLAERSNVTILSGGFVALLLPPAIVGGALAVAVATGTTPTFPWAGQPIIPVIAFVWIFVLGGPIQEEFGWRGYLP